MSDALTITFPMAPNMANARMHWRVKHNAKKEYWQMLDTLMVAKRIVRPPAQPLDRVGVTSLMVLWSQMDDDNAMARHKFLLDWLVTRGYVVDDKRPHLRWLGVPEQRISRKEPASITLTLTQDAA